MGVQQPGQQGYYPGMPGQIPGMRQAAYPQPGAAPRPAAPPAYAPIPPAGGPVNDGFSRQNPVAPAPASGPGQGPAPAGMPGDPNAMSDEEAMQALMSLLGGPAAGGPGGIPGAPGQAPGQMPGGPAGAPGFSAPGQAGQPGEFGFVEGPNGMVLDPKQSLGGGGGLFSSPLKSLVILGGLAAAGVAVKKNGGIKPLFEKLFKKELATAEQVTSHYAPKLEQQGTQRVQGLVDQLAASHTADDVANLADDAIKPHAEQIIGYQAEAKGVVGEFRDKLVQQIDDAKQALDDLGDDATEATRQEYAETLASAESKLKAVDDLIEQHVKLPGIKSQHVDSLAQQKEILDETVDADDVKALDEQIGITETLYSKIEGVIEGITKAAD